MIYASISERSAMAAVEVMKTVLGRIGVKDLERETQTIIRTDQRDDSNRPDHDDIVMSIAVGLVPLMRADASTMTARAITWP